MSPRTPVPRSKHFPHDEDISRERELSATPTIGSTDADFDELAVKMLKEKKTLKAELLQAQNIAQELTRKISNLQDENANLSANNVESSRQVVSLKAEITSVCDQLSSARSDLASMKATLESNHRDLASTKGDLITFRNQNLALAATNQELERYQGSVKAKLEVTQKALVSLRSDYATLFTSFTDLKRLHDSATAVITDLSDGVAECRRSANDALRRVEATCEDPNAITGTGQVRAVLDDLRETLSESYRTNDLLRDKLHLHLGQIVELTDRVKELESEKRDLLNSIVIRREEQASNEKLGSKIEDIADWLVKREGEFESVTADAVTFKAELRAAESRIVDLRQKMANDAPKLQLLATAQEESREAKAENEMLKKLLSEKEDRRTALERSISIATHQHNEYRKQLEGDLDLARSNEEKRENENASLLARVLQLQEMLSESRDALSQAEANTEIIKLRAENEREEAFKVLQASITELKCGISAKSAEYNVVETSLKKARQEIAEKETLLKQKSVQFNVLEERFEAQGATLRLAKEQCGDFQERLQTAERDQSVRVVGRMVSGVLTFLALGYREQTPFGNGRITASS
ncbi:hypothetical protein F5887DRAFT_163242 [Amanita rubescens]|nr:hypothetical protein F5887DRAFT_163242 [Amanita rubescens]